MGPSQEGQKKENKFTPTIMYAYVPAYPDAYIIAPPPLKKQLFRA